MIQARHLFIFLLALLTRAMPAAADTTDNYQIYLKNRLLLTEREFPPLPGKLIRFDQNNYSDTLEINFNHCVHGVSNRRIQLRDAGKRVFTEWKFADEDQEKLMKLPVLEILSIENLRPQVSYDLYFFDDQLPEGMWLGSIMAATISRQKATAMATPKIKSFNSLTWSIAILVVSLLLVGIYFHGKKAKA